jgi:hypothetical protein
MDKIEQSGIMLLSVFIGILAIGAWVLPVVLAAGPVGGSVTAGTPATDIADAPGSAVAYAGNVTGLTISGYSVTQSWQGFYGNVSGVIHLTDASNNTFYNWTLASPEGEVYASVNQTGISWADIQCFNFTASGIGSSEGGAGGQTNLYGVNLSQLEGRYNIAPDDVDGVNETFTLKNHDAFFTASQTFSADECRSTRVYGDTGEGVDQEFEETLLYEPTSGAVVFASILEEVDTLGFDNSNHDFEMLVLEDGHNSDVATTTYYFWVELE